MALLKFTTAPLASIVSGCLRLAQSRGMASVAGAAATGSTAPSAASTGAAKASADVGYTVTEVQLESTGKSRRTHATAMVKFVKGHTKKLNPIARQVAGKGVAEALVQMALSPSRRAPAVSRAITKAVNAARGPSGLPVAAFKIESAWTGKHTASPRIRHHSKGRAGRASKRTSKVWVKVRAMNAVEAVKLNRFRSASPTPASIAALDPRGY